jgi:hypothetical protein
MTLGDENWETYEHIVRDLLRGKLAEWFPHIPNSAVKVYGKRSFTGAKGTYEIDASAEIHLKDLKLLFVVECKFWKSQVSQDVVLSLRSKVEDLGAHKGIIVSRSGFQPGAIKVARANGIALWHYDPAPPKYFQPMVLVGGPPPPDLPFRPFCIRWIRGIRYNPASSRFYDNVTPWPIRLSTVPAVLKALAASFQPVWGIRLFVGRWRKGDIA